MWVLLADVKGSRFHPAHRSLWDLTIKIGKVVVWSWNTLGREHTMATLRTVTLRWVQRRELEQARDHDARPYVRERCAALLKIPDGTPAHAVARQGLLKSRDPDTVYAWLTHYRADGLAGLRGHRHGGYRRSRL
jgi:hypothetical protein